MKQINGFSKLTKAEKIQWLCDTYFPEVENAAAFFENTTTPMLNSKNATTSSSKIQLRITTCPLR